MNISWAEKHCLGRDVCKGPGVDVKLKALWCDTGLDRPLRALESFPSFPDSCGNLEIDDGEQMHTTVSSWMSSWLTERVMYLMLV